LPPKRQKKSCLGRKSHRMVFRPFKGVLRYHTKITLILSLKPRASGHCGKGFGSEMLLSVSRYARRLERGPGPVYCTSSPPSQPYVTFPSIPPSMRLNWEKSSPAEHKLNMQLGDQSL
jgi:hypothetical protein